VSLLWAPAHVTQALAETILITDHRTGASTPWRLNTEQQQMLRTISTGAWTFAAKPRQVGATTVTQFDDMLWCAINDAAGNRVRCGLYVDTEAKSKEREAFARSVKASPSLVDIFGDIDINSERVVFPKGSVLVFGTGSGKSEGRSGSYQRLHLSELPFWANPSTYGALIPSLSLDGQIVIETTLDVDAPNGLLARDLWRQQNRYKKLFFSVEDHGHEYRAPANAISEEQWMWAQEQGFTNRESAAWWLAVGLPDFVAGDVSRLMREYPQIPAHMFTAGASRWVPVEPKVTTPQTFYVCDGQRVPVWIPRDETCGSVVVSVDTGKGVEKDRTACVVLDRRSHRICAVFVSNTMDGHSFARVVRDLVARYTDPPPTKGVGWGVQLEPPPPPEVVVENNGIGEVMVLELRRLGVSVIDFHTTEASKAEGLILTRTGCVDGTLFGPKELAEEADDLCKDERGNWKGRKDLMMAIGFGLIRLRQSPWEPPAPRRRQGQVDVEAMLNRDTGTADW
jgi:hypothetical protein